MEPAARRAVERAIDAMRHNLADDLTIDDIARAAMFSKFHFSRVFREATGVSPGRFLSAMRLEEAKRLLLSTVDSVTEISHQVGYHSVGTFSSRFSSSVGMSPTTYRLARGAVPGPPPGTAHIGPARSGVHGRVFAPDGGDCGSVFVGLFPTRVPEGRPVRATVLDGPGTYSLPRVWPGTWYLLAQTVTGQDRRPGGHVGACGPIEVRACGVTRLADVRLRPRCAMDPPMLLALPTERTAVLRSMSG